MRAWRRAPCPPCSAASQVGVGNGCMAWWVRLHGLPLPCVWSPGPGWNRASMPCRAPAPAAPVHLTVEEQSDDDLLHLLAHDTGEAGCVGGGVGWEGVGG